MELQTVTITRPETFLVWLNFARPDLEATQRDVEILLGYMAGHDYVLGIMCFILLKNISLYKNQNNQIDKKSNQIDIIKHFYL